jgi:cephalosporin hydroxylase
MVMRRIARELARPFRQLHRVAAGQKRGHRRVAPQDNPAKPQPLDPQVVRDTFFTELIRKTNDFGRITWLGQPIWQSVLDLWTIQETIAEIQPELLIETGTNRGGSSLFFAHLMDLMGHGKIITIDVEKLHSLSHPRITYLLGSSTAPEIVSRVRQRVSAATGPVLGILDSDHSRQHVAAELEAYTPFVTEGSYCLVQDGVIDVLPMMTGARPGPLPSIDDFAARHTEFEIDHARSERFLISHHPRGWLRRKAA